MAAEEEELEKELGRVKERKEEVRWIEIVLEENVVLLFKDNDAKGVTGMDVVVKIVPPF